MDIALIALAAFAIPSALVILVGRANARTQPTGSPYAASGSLVAWALVAGMGVLAVFAVVAGILSATS